MPGRTTADRLVIRPAGPDDITAMRTIEVASFGDPWSEAAFRSMLAQPQVVALVATRGPELLGYGVGWQLADEGEVANLAVAATARRAGVGGILLDEMLGAIAARGAVTVYLEVREGNTAAQALYRSRGFTEAGRRRRYYSGPEEDAVVMRRPVAG